MKKLKLVVLAMALTTSVGLFAQNMDNQKIMTDAEAAKKALIDRENKLSEFFDSAAGYVIFPNVGEGGFIIGAASGNGVLYENGVPSGMVDLKKLDVGFQIGGQAITEVIFFETEEALTEFKTDEYRFSGQVAAVALKKGKSQNLNYNHAVLVVAMPKAGLMADVSVGGQKFSYTPMDDND